MQALPPLYLLADSQLLFWRTKEAMFLESILQHVTAPQPAAAYIGASNGDSPEAFEIFVEAMRAIGVQDRRMIRSTLPAEDEALLSTANILVLAGGDVARGWKVFTETKLKDCILERLAGGAVVIGVSAGAVQLGRYAMVEKPDSSIELLDTFARVPFILSAHDERRNWETLRQTVQLMEGTVHGIGIPSGGGLIFHPDATVEAVRHPLQEFSYRDGKVISSLIYQPG